MTATEAPTALLATVEATERPVRRQRRRISGRWMSVIRQTIVALIVLVLWQLELNSDAARSLVNLVLCFALILTATSLIFRKAIMDRYRRRMERLGTAITGRATVLVGVALGTLVSISSVGAGAVGVTALLLLYPRLPMATAWPISTVRSIRITRIAIFPS